MLSQNETHTSVARHASVSEEQTTGTVTYESRYNSSDLLHVIRGPTGRLSKTSVSPYSAHIFL